MRMAVGIILLGWFLQTIILSGRDENRLFVLLASDAQLVAGAFLVGIRDNKQKGKT